MEVIQSVSERLGGATIAATSVVPDDVVAIQQVLKRWSDVDHLNLILTTGSSLYPKLFVAYKINHLLRLVVHS